MPSPASGLDPAAPEARGWIAVQLVLALRPELVVRVLSSERDPWRALASLAPWVRVPDDTRLDEVRSDLIRAAVGLVPHGSSAYPEALAAIPDPPAVLSVTGDAAVLRRPCVAIVGARAASAYGVAVARSLAAELAAAGVVIVSGLARGIDAAAHRGALEAGGITVAVQACGPPRVYPASHRGLARDVARRGAVLTEMPPGTAPRGEFFPLRNRIISGLSGAVVVVEARRRSGSLVTARHALQQGIDVLAVPGPITAPTSEGPNALLRDGAGVVLEAADVLTSLALPVRGSPPAAPPLSPGLQAILDALRTQPASRDELAARLGRTVDALALDLLELELGGRVQQGRDGNLCAV